MYWFSLPFQGSIRGQKALLNLFVTSARSILHILQNAESLWAIMVILIVFSMTLLFGDFFALTQHFASS